MDNIDPNATPALLEYLLRLGDDQLVLGHRLSEWCGHGPVLEIDIALTNLSLDCIGAASNLLHLAGVIEGKRRSEDDLAYFREATEFRNCLLVEQPNGDFGYTMVRQFLFDVYSYLLFDELQSSKCESLAAIAAKSVKEVRYHLRHCGEWLVRLGDGTEESHLRVQESVNDLWRFTGELFVCDRVVSELVADAIAPDVSALKTKWVDMVKEVFKRATLELPKEHARVLPSGRVGLHTEHLGHMLAPMQIVARSHPGATW